MHGDFGYGVRSKRGGKTLDSDTSYDLDIANKYLRRSDEYLITFTTELNFA